jgi:outer membrane biosynthesis protein TonB
MPVFEMSFWRASHFVSTRWLRLRGFGPVPSGLAVFGTAAFRGALLALGLGLGGAGLAQQPPPGEQPAAREKQQTSPTQAPAAAPQVNQPAGIPVEPAAGAGAAPAQAPLPAPALELPKTGKITEDVLKRMLVGKPLYLRGGYLDDALAFDEGGVLIGHSPQGSYTLSVIQIDRVRLNKHRVEVEGVRYGLHFLAATPDHYATQAIDRVRITPKKKVVKITIDRELVIVPNKKKERVKAKDNKTPLRASAQAPAGQAQPAASPAANPTADPESVTTANSPAHAKKLFQDALGRVFATGVDDRMIAAMPDFWGLYYQTAAAGTDYRPADPSVMRQADVDKKAVLISTVEPQSNELAQTNGVAGPAFYHAVIGVDGKAEQIVVARPIGFGLDENAVEAIRKASFEPAIKDGKPVPVLLDLSVQFHIYSKRTASTDTPGATDPRGQQLPGPFSAAHP